MTISKVSGFELSGINVVLPTKSEDNADLKLLNKHECDQLILHTGIKYRRVADKQDNILDYFKVGVEKLLEQLNWSKSDVDIIICVTQTLKTSIPSFSCKLHGDLDFLKNTMCFDINSGCSGYVYGLNVAMSLMQSVLKEDVKAILCCGDLSTHLINPEDKSTVPIFSDAISVTGIASANSKLINYFNLETEGSGKNAIKIDDFYMNLNGIDVFNYSIRLVPEHINNLLNAANLKVVNEEIFVLHQANKLINEAIAKKLKIDLNNTPSSLYSYGNTASASIPLTLGLYYIKNPINRAVLCGFGVGFSIASALIQISPNFSFNILEK